MTRRRNSYVRWLVITNCLAEDGTKWPKQYEIIEAV